MSRVWVWFCINLFWLMPIVASAWLAARRNRTAPLWALFAVFGGWVAFGILALISETVGPGKRGEARDLLPPDLRAPETMLATAPVVTAPPGTRSLVAWIVGLAVISGLVAATAGTSGNGPRMLDIGRVGMAEAGRNATGLVSSLRRDHDSMTFERFARERVRRLCGDTAASSVSLWSFASMQAGTDVFWAVYLSVEAEIEPRGKCDELEVMRLSQLALAGVSSRDGEVVPIFETGQPADPDLPLAGYFNDFRAGKAP